MKICFLQFYLSSVTVTLATDMSHLPDNVSASDRLRFAASKGQLETVKELLAVATDDRPDRVRGGALSPWPHTLGTLPTHTS